MDQLQAAGLPAMNLVCFLSAVVFIIVVGVCCHCHNCCCCCCCCCNCRFSCCCCNFILEILLSLLSSLSPLSSMSTPPSSLSSLSCHSCHQCHHQPHHCHRRQVDIGRRLLGVGTHYTHYSLYSRYRFSTSSSLPKLQNISKCLCSYSILAFGVELRFSLCFYNHSVIITHREAPFRKMTPPFWHWKW